MSFFGSSYFEANHFEANYLDADSIVVVVGPEGTLSRSFFHGELETMASPKAVLSVPVIRAALVVTPVKGALTTEQYEALLTVSKPTAALEEA